MAVCSTVLPLVGLVAPAHAFQLQIDSKAPYMCLQATSTNASRPPSGSTVVAACDMTFGQQWNYVNGQILTIAGGGTGVTTWCLGTFPNSMLYACSAIPSYPGYPPGYLTSYYQWSFFRAGDGAVINQVVGQDSDAFECLANTGGSSVGVTPCSWSDNQNWLLTDMVLAQHGNCAAVEASETTDGTPVIAFSCSGAFNKLWTYAGQKGLGQIQGIGTANGTSTCLTASSLAIGALVQLSTCSSEAAGQSWDIGPGPRGGTAIMLDFGIESHGDLVDYTLCLDSALGPAVGGGTQLIVNVCTGAASQNWDLR